LRESGDSQPFSPEHTSSSQTGAAAKKVSVPNFSQAGEFSIRPLDDGSYSVLIGTRSYRVTNSRAGEFLVNGRSIAVQVFDPRALRNRGSGSAAQGRQKITAPMPGRIIRLLAAVGDPVEAGQGLVVVEAMKMQNEMKSPKAGRVTEIKTKEGAAVSAGDVLVVVE
jgi:biotin carboxyl carrier protein